MKYFLFCVLLAVVLLVGNGCTSHQCPVAPAPTPTPKPRLDYIHAWQMEVDCVEAFVEDKEKPQWVIELWNKNNRKVKRELLLMYAGQCAFQKIVNVLEEIR